MPRIGQTLITHTACRNHIEVYDIGEVLNRLTTKEKFIAASIDINHRPPRGQSRTKITMATVKIAHNSPSRAKPSELESSIAQALYDLETQVADYKASLRPLQFHSAREVGIL